MDGNPAAFDATWSVERVKLLREQENLSNSSFFRHDLLENPLALPLGNRSAMVKNTDAMLPCDKMSRAGMLRSLLEDVQYMYREVTLNRAELCETEGKISQLDAKLTKLRCEDVSERAEALRRVGREERKRKQAHWRFMLLDTPLQRRTRLVRALADKVLAYLTFQLGMATKQPAYPLYPANLLAQKKSTPISHAKSRGARVKQNTLSESTRDKPARTLEGPPSSSLSHRNLHTLHQCDSGCEPQYPLDRLMPLYASRTYLPLKPDEFRLLEVRSNSPGLAVEVTLQVFQTTTCPPYAAVSYTWGDPQRCKSIHVDGEVTKVRENIWAFLLSLQTSSPIKESYLWIDALCIDQNNVLERNHQVQKMRAIYQNASKILVWLGKAADASDLAMDYLSGRGLTPLKPKANGYRPMWCMEEGKAILALCERVYWRRIWIIQEVIHAHDIMVCCGNKTFPWRALENVYQNLKAIEVEGRQRHHRYAAQVLDSVACTVVWQRAHWRHAETPTPDMVQLVRIFRDWQAGDIRDKVNALNGLVSSKSSILIEYNNSRQQVFEAVREAAPEWDSKEDTLLREVLGLPFPYFRREKRAPPIC